MITWAVGHLVGLAEPDAYDPKLKKWRFADLPIIPDEFKLVPNDERAAKQLQRDPQADGRRRGRPDRQRLRRRPRGRADLRLRLRDCAKVKKPVERLWLSSMTKKAIGEAFEQLRPGEEMKPLEAAARSRSEADWVVGMNATRAASRSACARPSTAPSRSAACRRRRWRWSPAARRRSGPSSPSPTGSWRPSFAGERRARSTRAATWAASGCPPRRTPTAIVEAATGQPGEITKLEKKEERERPQLLYDLTSLQRHANTLLRLLGAPHAGGRPAPLRGAQGAHLPAHQLALPDRRHGPRDQADRRAGRPQRRRTGAASEYVPSLDKLPLGRVVNDKKVEDHHAIIPTRSEHDLGRMGQDELKVYDLVAKRFLAVFHPEAVYERTRVETTVERARLPHQRPAAGRGRLEGRLRRGGRRAARRGRLGRRPAAAEARARARRSRRCSVESMRKETQPPRRFTDASLLGAMETAGKEVEDAELREAMKDSGIGTPATRASIIELLVNREYIEREGRSLVATEKGIQVIRLLERPPAHLAGADRQLGAPARPDRARRGQPRGVHARHRQVHRRDGRRSWTSSRACRSSAPSSAPARSAAARSPRTARATRAGRARTRAAAS